MPENYIATGCSPYLTESPSKESLGHQEGMHSEQLKVLVIKNSCCSPPNHVHYYGVNLNHCHSNNIAMAKLMS